MVLRKKRVLLFRKFIDDRIRRRRRRRFSKRYPGRCPNDGHLHLYLFWIVRRFDEFQSDDRRDEIENSLGIIGVG